MAATRRRGGQGDGEPRFVATAAWQAAFLAQSTEKTFIEETARAALRRAHLVASTGRKIDDLYARELVLDIIDDTLEGRIAWDPTRVSLKKHVIDAIRSRTRHHYVRATRFPHQSLDITQENAVLAAAESALAREGLNPRVACAAREALERIRSMAASDPDVLALIDAYAHGIDKKPDVMQMTELTSKRYEAAQNRLERFALDLPNSLRDALKGNK